MAGLKESVKVNVEGAILGAQEEGFNFVNQFRLLPPWKQRIIIVVAIAIIPCYLIARVGVEQYLSAQYGRLALSAHSAFTAALPPTIGNMTIIQNPSGTYSGVAQITNQNLDLAASGIQYTANFSNSSGQNVYSVKGVMYLLPNEKKYLVFPNINVGTGSVAKGLVTLDNVNWQKKLNLPDVKLRATEPILSDETNPLTFIAQVSVINESPYQIASAQIVFLLYDGNNRIIGVSEREENKLVPFGRRTWNQLWPGLYKDQVKKVQIIPTTNTLDPLNITIDPTQTPQKNTNDVNIF